MNTRTVTVSTKGQLVIPAEIREALHIKPGTRFAVRRDGNQIVLRPINKGIIDELCGLTAGGPSMTERLLADRHKEYKRSKW